MIVKNEIRCIERCLRALQPLREAIPCELVIADTGSDDGTREVAERYADTLFDFEWVNDFSAARNAVMDRCSGKWSLTVDADEYLDPNFTQLTTFLTGQEERRYRWGCVNIVNYTDPEMKGATTSFFGCRLVKMEQHPRYVGAIHEAFPVIVANETIILMDVKFHHDGYVIDHRHPDRHIRKMERNLTLLDQELKKNPRDPRRLMQCLESAVYVPG